MCVRPCVCVRTCVCVFPHALTSCCCICRSSRNEKVGRPVNTSSSGATTSSTTTTPSSSSSLKSNSRQHGVALRGKPTGVPQMQVEKDSRAASRGASVATNGGMPSDYQVGVVTMGLWYTEGGSFPKQDTPPPSKISSFNSEVSSIILFLSL